MITRSTKLAALLVFVAAFTLYASTLAPTITWAHNGTDGGDLITAAATWGVPHPPGYPTYVTLGYLFSKIPIGSVAYRLNLMSALFTAMAAALTTLTICRITTTRAPRFAREGIGILAGLTFAASPMTWGQATIAEVHGLNALCVALISFLIAPIVFRSEKTSSQYMAFTTFLWGLSAGNLLTIAALAPLMIVAWRRTIFVPQPASLFLKVRSAALPIIAFLLGLSVYLLIPLRAAAQAPINWGNAVTLDNFWRQVSAQLYHGYVFALPLGEYPHRLIAFGQLIVAQFGWIGVLLGAIGVLRALNSPNKSWRWLTLPIALYAIFAFTYNTIDADLYLIPIWMFSAWAIARGVLSIHDWLSHHTARFTLYSSVVTAGIVFIIPLNIIITNFAFMDLSHDSSASDFAQQMWSHLPPNAILLTSSDAQTFALWYYRAIDKQRPDVSVVDTRMSEADWYNQMVISQGGAPRLVSFDPADSWQQRLHEANPDRPLCEVSATINQPEVKCQ